MDTVQARLAARAMTPLAYRLEHLERARVRQMEAVRLERGLTVQQPDRSSAFRKYSPTYLLKYFLKNFRSGDWRSPYAPPDICLYFKMHVLDCSIDELKARDG